MVNVGKLLSGCDAALVISPYNTRYLSGYESTNCIIAVTGDRAYYITDDRYYNEAKTLLSDRFEVVSCGSGDVYAAAFAVMGRRGVSRVAYDEDITYGEYKKATSDASFTYVPLGSRLRDMRAVKSEYEIDCIKRAQAIAEKSFGELLGDIREGITEREAAYTLEYYMKRNGGEEISFDTIMAFGDHTATPHAHPTDRKLERGMLVTADFGTTIDGYHSDMTRTFAFGKPSGEEVKIYDAVLEAQLLALDRAAAGVSCRECDAEVRRYFDSKGYGKYFVHSLGHGVGVEIHEEPRLSPTSEQVLVAGNVVSVEPGLYIDGECGVRIEDLVVVREGGAENINEFEKKLLTL